MRLLGKTNKHNGLVAANVCLLTAFLALPCATIRGAGGARDTLKDRATLAAPMGRVNPLAPAILNPAEKMRATKTPDWIKLPPLSPLPFDRRPIGVRVDERYPYDLPREMELVLRRGLISVEPILTPLDLRGAAGAISRMTPRRKKPKIGTRAYRPFTATMLANPIAPTNKRAYYGTTPIGRGVAPRQPLVMKDLGLRAHVPLIPWRFDMKPWIAPLQTVAFPGARKGYSY